MWVYLRSHRMLGGAFLEIVCVDSGSELFRQTDKDEQIAELLLKNDRHDCRMATTFRTGAKILGGFPLMLTSTSVTSLKS